MQLSKQSTSALWRRVHEAIDRREDPLADSELAEELANHPELAAQVVQMLVDLESLPPASTDPSRLTLRGPYLASYAAAAALLLALVAVWYSLPDQPTALVPLATPVENPALALRVHEPSFQITIEHHTLEGRHRTLHTNRALLTEFSPRKHHRLLDARKRSDGTQLALSSDRLIHIQTTALPPQN